MRSLILFITILWIFGLQCAESRSNYDLNESVLLNNDQRGISDVWASLKNIAKNAWCSIKDIAEKTKETIDKWMENAKVQVHEIAEKFEYRIKNLREKSKKILEEFLGTATGQLVKDCFQKQNETVEELFNNIIKYVSVCISDGKTNVSRMDEQVLKLNETAFVSEIENNMNECLKKHDADECLHKVRKDVFLIMENMENKILTRRMESRGIASDLIDTVMSCSIEGLIDASNVIAAETLQIIACVLKG